MRISLVPIQPADVASLAPTIEPPIPPPSLADIYRAEVDYVWHGLRRLGIPQADLPDVTHDVFVAVSRALPRFEPERPLRPWLFGITYRVASTHRRLFRNVREVPHAAVECADGAPDPEQSLLQAERRDRAVECLGHLDLKHRAVLIMHDFHGHEVGAIAEALAIPIKTVYSRLSTARRRFSEAAEKLARAGRAEGQP